MAGERGSGASRSEVRGAVEELVTSRKMKQAVLGFRVHTGWAAMVAVAQNGSRQPSILDRRRIEMIDGGGGPEGPRFVYHAAAKLKLDAAKRAVQEAEAAALSRAKNELGAAIRELHEAGYEVIASGVIAGNRPFSSPFEATLQSHSLIHAAEGELFRQAIIRASEANRVPVTSVPARELYSRVAKHLRVSTEVIRQRLNEAGRGMGSPWAQDQKESFAVALLALGVL